MAERTDTERLDWLESIEPVEGMTLCQTVIGRDIGGPHDRFIFYNRNPTPPSEGRSLRAAIDAAMDFPPAGRSLPEEG